MRLDKEQVLETCETRDEADQACKRWAATVVKLGIQNAWGVYVKPYRVPRRRNWWFAVVLGRQE